MALRDQPYFPLYVQDFLTDEKLNCCSASTQGVYIKILCILHKQDEYGCILFKQKDKQTDDKLRNFALKFAKLLPFDSNTIYDALIELVDENVLIIEGDKLYQKRMVKDGQISMSRSIAGKTGGGNPILFKQKDKQKDKQNTENENENENIIEFIPQNYIEIVSLWLDYKKKKKQSYKGKESIKIFFKRLLEFSGGDPGKARKIVENSIANNYSGIFELKHNGTHQRVTTRTEQVNREAAETLASINARL